MRVAFVTESFLPQVNGVTHSVLRMLEHLRSTGDEAVVIAPGEDGKAPDHYAGFPVITLPSIGLPGYSDVRVSTSSQRAIERVLRQVEPDVVHVAGPFLLGYKALMGAARLQLPTVALYQTEIATYAARYGAPQLEGLFWSRLRKAHQLATVNLAPSSYARDQLTERGFPRVSIWGRGVDTQRFHPAKRDQALHASWAGSDQRVVGYAGRLASEKRVADLQCVANNPQVQLVIVGDGPERQRLEKLMPEAIFTGQLLGDDLARHMASFDLFVHPGDLETFGQTLQESKASGVPVIAPGRGGPIDLVDPSRTGWLYPPGDLAALRGHIEDLVGDDSKRIAIGIEARRSVESRTWPAYCSRLREYYVEAIRAGSLRNAGAVWI